MQTRGGNKKETGIDVLCKPQQSKRTVMLYTLNYSCCHAGPRPASLNHTASNGKLGKGPGTRLTLNICRRSLVWLVVKLCIPYSPLIPLACQVAHTKLTFSACSWSSLNPESILKILVFRKYPVSVSLPALCLSCIKALCGYLYLLGSCYRQAIY